MAQGGTLAASPEEDRDVGGLSSPKTVSPATTRRLLPGRAWISLLSLMDFLEIKTELIADLKESG